MIKIGDERPIKRCELNYNGYEIRRLKLLKVAPRKYLVVGLQKDIMGNTHGWIGLYLGSLRGSRIFINNYEEDEEGNDGYYCVLQ